MVAISRRQQLNANTDKPNQKWLTDVTEFSIPAGKVYLSPIIDCYDGMPIAWNISCKPDAQLVNTMLDRATRSLPLGAHPILHSDRGCHYRWPGWIKRTDDAGVTRSMSRKGCSPDNSACEGFLQKSDAKRHLHGVLATLSRCKATSQGNSSIMVTRTIYVRLIIIHGGKNGKLQRNSLPIVTEPEPAANP